MNKSSEGLSFRPSSNYRSYSDETCPTHSTFQLCQMVLEQGQWRIRINCITKTNSTLAIIEILLY